jgi:formylglycine-generating enzyme required for sulfatase activity
VPIVLLLASVAPGLCSGPTVTSSAGDRITVSIGAAEGVRVGMTGRILKQVSAGDRAQALTIARLRVTAIRSHECQAALTARSPDFPIEPGLAVVFDERLVPPAGAKAAAKSGRPEQNAGPTNATPPEDSFRADTTLPAQPEEPLEPDPGAILRLASDAWEREDWQAAARGYERLLQLSPGHPIAEERLKVCRRKIEERAQAQAEAQARAEAGARERKNLSLYRETARILLSEGKQAEALPWLKKIQAVEPGDSLVVQQLAEFERAARQLAELQRGLQRAEFQRAVEGTMVLVPAGTFKMGSRPGEGGSNERPQRSVYLDTFYVDMHEVTNEQFRGFIEAGGYRDLNLWSGEGWAWRSGANVTEPQYWRSGEYNCGPRYPRFPVVGVSWYEADAYARWAGKRLPTEAEWEKAARGTDGRKYPWGNEESDAGGVYRANFGQGPDHEVWKRDGWEYSAPVGSLLRGASPYGARDMAGNVWEWTADLYSDAYYGSSPLSNPSGPASGVSRVLRGGSCFNGADNLRCASRGGFDPSTRSGNVGFRCATTSR